MYTCIQWPSGWPGGNLLNVITVTVLIHMTLGLVCTVVIHLYFRCLYVTAHVTALSVVVGGLVILHHCVKVRQALGLSHNCFRWLQILGNVILLSCSCCMAIVYSMLFTRGRHVNYDYLGAFVWAYVDSALLFYLLVVCSDAGELLSYTDVEDDNRKVTWKCVIWRVMSWLMWVTGQLITVFIFVLSAYNAAATFHNLRHRMADVVTVSQPLQHPVSLYVKCEGSGEDLVILEHDLGGTSRLSWPGLPLALVNLGHRVCVYDRRGIGDSEGYNADPSMTSQWSRTSVLDLELILKVMNITEPFYMIGHGYGGHHIIYTALKFPERVKGLIFLDSFDFNSTNKVFTKVTQQDLDLMCRFLPTGFQRFLVDTAVIDLGVLLSDLYDFDDVPVYTKKETFFDILSDETLCTIEREHRGLQKYSRPTLCHLARQLSQLTFIYSRVLVIDRHWRPYWFPDHMFPYYDRSQDHHRVISMSHPAILYRQSCVRIIAAYVNAFLRKK